MQLKVTSEFYKNARTATGLTSYCKGCTKASVKSWKAGNPNWRKPEYDQKYRATHVEQDRARASEWSKNNRAKRNATQQARRAREYSGGTYSAEEWLELCKTFGNVCLACGSENITVDHVVPLASGGTNTIDNLQPLCGPCNSSKGNKTIDYRKSMVS